MNYMPSSLVDILQWRAKHQPNGLAYRFLTDGENDEVEITYEALDQRARSIGAALQASTKVGDRALLLFPAGLDFIAAFFGCLYAKVIAIPAPPPHPVNLEKSLAATLRIAGDATPAAVLLSSALFDAIRANNTVRDQFGKMKLLATDKDDLKDWAQQWQQPDVGGPDIAFLQYTSGSTTLPKGVMVSHNNLLQNLGLNEQSMGLSSITQGVFWLPHYHDMGLIGGILQSIYTGYPVTLMPHLLFLQRPIRWLQAITRFQGTLSAAPNFAYDLCVKKIKPEQRELLDLSTWDVAVNGAEPIYHKTLDQFAAYFAPCGFRRETFFPCYGLAEATLMVVGGPKTRLPVLKNLLKSGLEENKAILSPESSVDTQTLVSCGQNLARQNIKIVSPATLIPCLMDQIGEVWVSGPCVASGYWNQALATTATFAAHLADSGEGPFLRTGDLGFMQDGELFISGRLKNMIIIDGKNHYPHDIERTVEKAHPAIRLAGCAVFSIEDSGSERVVVIAEIQHKHVGDTAKVAMAVRKAVSEQHELPLYEIILTLPGSIPKTSSGKTKHFLLKNNYLTGQIKAITAI